MEPDPDLDFGLEQAVGLLERALAYTRGTLADVRPEHLRRRTPCARWDLGDLLRHMDDGLSAFLEASAGQVRVDPVPPPRDPVDGLRQKACTLLGAWMRSTHGSVRVEDAALPAALLVSTAALEITVHGWDVGRATGLGGPVPPGLSGDLLPLARVVSAASEDRFDPPREPASPESALIACLGRGVKG